MQYCRYSIDQVVEDEICMSTVCFKKSISSKLIYIVPLQSQRSCDDQKEIIVFIYRGGPNWALLKCVELRTPPNGNK
jgi:hypothetical protein